ncbi:glycosyltransferase family 4 protein [Candidatus Falkowbacteria bacterium]|nr:glycosyltransferase family 4 protein [Candidatus Falkowbacteria bacterium]
MENKKIKIAMMSYAMDNRPNKGTALYTRKLVENLLSDDGLELSLVHFKKMADPLYDNGREIIMPSLNLPRGNQFFSQLLFFWQYRKNKFDIIHWFQPRLYPFYWLAPAKKIIVTAHGAGELTAAKTRLLSSRIFRFILKNLNNRVDIVIAVSENAREEIIKYYKIPPEKTKAVYNGGGENYQPLEKGAALAQIKNKYRIGAPFILDVSRLMPHKNINSLIEAYMLYRDKYSGPEKLVIVGSPMFDYKKTYSLAENCRYKDDIYFIDFVKQEDLNAVYSAAEVFVFPSLSEGFGLPAIEAMASGTPVITSNITSLPEVAGEAAILIDPLNVEEMAETINKVLSDENLKNDLIKNGLVQAKKFTWEKTAKQTKEIYLNLMRKAD